MSMLKLKKGFAIGMIHLPPVRECISGGYGTIRRLTEIAKNDARVLQESGFDGVMIQNGKDVCRVSQSDNFTVALLSSICGEIRGSVSIPLGVSVLKNDVTTALSIAKATGMEFVRCKVYVGAAVSAEGMVEGCAPQAVAYRDQLGCPEVELWSETYDLSSRPLLEMPFEDTIKWCKKMQSDSYLVTGRSHQETLDYCRRAKKIVGDQKVIIGGGVNLRNLEQSLEVCDGFVVGSAVEKVPFTGPVSPELAQEFIRALERCR